MTANAVHTFDWPCREGITIPFRLLGSVTGLTTPLPDAPIGPMGDARRAESVLDITQTFDNLFVLLNRQRLSRVVEGTGPKKPQQPGASAKVLIPAQWG
jgi:hypothetical protein